MSYLAFLELIKNDEFLAKLIAHKSQAKNSKSSI